MKKLTALWWVEQSIWAASLIIAWIVDWRVFVIILLYDIQRAIETYRIIYRGDR